MFWLNLCDKSSLFSPGRTKGEPSNRLGCGAAASLPVDPMTGLRLTTTVKPWGETLLFTEAALPGTTL